MSQRQGRILKLASYNVHNLGRADSSGSEAYRAKLGLLVNVLRGIGADFVVVNEVREGESFEELAEACDMYPSRILGGTQESGRELHTGMMTRLPVIEQGEWRGFPAVESGRAGMVTTLEFRRPVPWVKVELANGEVLFAAGVHLKSRRPDVEAIPETESARRREVLGLAVSAAARALEAGGLRCLFDAVMEDRKADHYAALGDFNDPSDSVAVRLVCGPTRAMTNDEWRMSNGGRRTEEAVLNGERRMWDEDRWRLFAAAEGMEGDRLFSYAGSGRKEMIDQILVSRGLYALMSRAGVEVGLLDSCSDVFVGSDHAPVWAEFNLKERSEEK